MDTIKSQCQSTIYNVKGRTQTQALTKAYTCVSLALDLCFWTYLEKIHTSGTLNKIQMMRHGNTSKFNTTLNLHQTKVTKFCFTENKFGGLD